MGRSADPTLHAGDASLQHKEHPGRSCEEAVAESGAVSTEVSNGITT